MGSFKEFLEIFKLPPNILAAISIATGLILFLPERIISIIHLTDFKNSFGPYIGVFFIISITMLFVLIFIWLYKKIIEEYRAKKLIKSRIKYLKELDENKTKLIKKFIEKEDHTLNLAFNNGITIELSNYNLISLAGNTQPVTFGYDIFENNMCLNYFLQPWVMNLIKKEEILINKFYKKDQF